MSGAASADSAGAPTGHAGGYAVPANAAKAQAATARTQRLLQAPWLPTLLALATPNVLGLVANTVVIGYDGYIIGRLGPDALAGLALVFPLAMLMLQMSAGGVGGAVSAVVARALGASQPQLANRLALQALWVTLGMALVFAVVLGSWGRPLFLALGGHGAALDAALAYGTVLFGGGLAVWLCNVLSGVVRGSGQMGLPAALLAGSALLHLGLCPLLVFGAGAWPGLGVAGAALSTLLTHGLAALVLLAYLMRGHGALHLQLAGWRPNAAVLRQILRLALPASLSPVLSNASIVLATAWIGRYGTAALAGYGLAARLEFILVPIAFGFGTALTTLVATNLGAGQRERALRITWGGSALVAVLTGGIGLAAALWPMGWMRLFSQQPEVLAFGASYLQVAGPFYGFFGLGLALFFASQGAGRMFWPLVGSVSRLVVVGLGGWWVIGVAHGGPQALFAVVAAGYAVYALVISASIALGRWRGR